MNNVILNVRIGIYHLQILRGGRPRISRNDLHRGLPHGFFQVYALPWRRPK